MLKILVKAILITIAVVLGGWKLRCFAFKDDTTLPLTITEIRVVGGGSGNVEIHPGAESQVTIHRDVRYLIKRPGITHRIDGTVLYLDTSPNSYSIVSYIVNAPKNVQISGTLGSGNLRLAGVSSVNFKNSSGRIEINEASGTMKLETSSGAITLTGVNGDITAKSSSGPIMGRELQSANIDAATSSGKIALDMTMQGDVQAKTSSGKINLTVPNNSYRIDTKVNTGTVHINVAKDQTSTHHLNLNSDSGDITVSPR